MSAKQTFAAFVIFIFSAAGIAVFAFWPFSEKITQERHATRVIVPVAADDSDMDSALAENMINEDSYSLKAPLGDGEFAISVLNIDFTGEAIEEQIVAYRSVNDGENPISIAFFGFDDRGRGYRRLWNAPVAATMPGTVSLYTQDLIGDRSLCVIITGMNLQGEHTITVFRKDPQEDHDRPFSKIAEIQIGGSITVQELERPLAYQQGIAGGQPFVITASGHDGESDNMLDRVEITYAFNPVRMIYEQSRLTHVAGRQIEERRLREILSGDSNVFEEFINDLWYHVSPEGIIDKSQYLYFDPEKREIIFFIDDTQQIFAWQNSHSTRYGLYISSRNITVSTLLRYLDIELESLDNIYVRVREDVRMKINFTSSWDGSYRRAGTIMRASTEERSTRPYTDAIYDSSMGRLRFYAGGEYELSSGGLLTKGRYAFFRVGSNDLLELRPDRGGAKNENGDDRLIYNLKSMNTTERDNNTRSENLSLSRVRLGAAGIHELHEPPIILTKAQ